MRLNLNGEGLIGWYLSYGFNAQSLKKEWERKCAVKNLVPESRRDWNATLDSDGVFLYLNGV